MVVYAHRFGHNICVADYGVIMVKMMIISIWMHENDYEDKEEHENDYEDKEEHDNDNSNDNSDDYVDDCDDHNKHKARELQNCHVPSVQALMVPLFPFNATGDISSDDGGDTTRND